MTVAKTKTEKTNDELAGRIVGETFGTWQVWGKSQFEIGVVVCRCIHCGNGLLFPARTLQSNYPKCGKCEAVNDLL